MKIDFVSDVACPWCAVGLWSLDRALERLGDAVDVDLRFQPFELNPTLPPEGAIERPQADRAPRAGDIGNEIDLHRGKSSRLRRVAQARLRDMTLRSNTSFSTLMNAV